MAGKKKGKSASKDLTNVEMQGLGSNDKSPVGAIRIRGRERRPSTVPEAPLTSTPPLLPSPTGDAASTPARSVVHMGERDDPASPTGSSPDGGPSRRFAAASSHPVNVSRVQDVPSQVEMGQVSWSSEGEDHLPPCDRNNFTPSGFSDFWVADLDLAEFGRKEMEIAEREMKGLMLLRNRLSVQRPLAGARIIGCMHLNVRTAVFIETLIELGADVRWCSSNMYSTQDEAAAALAMASVPVFAWKGETEEEFWRCIRRVVEGEQGAGWEPNLVVDSAGEITALMARDYPNLSTGLLGITEETQIGVHRLQRLAAKNRLPAPALNISKSVTKAMFDTFYNTREFVIECVKRATAFVFSGKRVVVVGFGDVGKGCCAALARAGSVVSVVEVDPICGLQAAMEGYDVMTMDDAALVGDLFITATGNRDVINRLHMNEMKDNAIVCNVGHVDSEISVSSLTTSDLHWRRIKPHVHQVVWPSGKKLTLLARGRQLNYAFSHGSSSFVTSVSFCNQALALIDLFNADAGSYINDVYLIPKLLDEEVARLHLPCLQAKLERLTTEQGAYIGVSPDGPFKDEFYRY